VVLYPIPQLSVLKSEIEPSVKITILLPAPTFVDAVNTGYASSKACAAFVPPPSFVAPDIAVTAPE